MHSPGMPGHFVTSSAGYTISPHSPTRPNTGASIPVSGHTFSGHSRTRPRRTSRSSRSRSSAGNAGIEYEWQDLPPIIKMKDAVTRRKVSGGINYILPVDKSKNSVENVYRTNLRVVFQEPYLKECKGFDEMKLKASASHHFVTNHPATPYRPKPELGDYVKYEVNAESANIRSIYSQTAPSLGLTGRDTRADSDKLKVRSRLNLPMKTALPSEAIILKKEAERIIKSVQKQHEADTDTTVSPEKPLSAKLSLRKQSSGAFSSALISDDEQGIKTRTPSRKASRAYRNYQECKDAYTHMSREIPNEFESPYMAQKKNQDVWSWLNNNDTKNDFNHFMNVCS